MNQFSGVWTTLCLKSISLIRKDKPGSGTWWRFTGTFISHYYVNNVSCFQYCCRFLECFLELEYVTLRIHMDLIFDEINPTVIPPNFSFNLNHLVKLKEVCIYECDVILFRLLNLKLLVALGFDDFPMVQSSPPLTHTDYKKLVKNCPNIRELICKIYSFEIFPQTIEILCKGLPLLHSLDIRVNANQWRLKGIPKCREFLRTILENCKNLQKLTIVRFAGAECDYEKILEEFAEKLGQMDLCLRYFSKRSKSLDRILYERNWSVAFQNNFFGILILILIVLT